MPNPLHAEPLMPISGGDGVLANPLRDGPTVQMENDRPLAYDDLLPDTSYVHGQFEYLTDECARPARVRGLLRMVPSTERVRHPAQQRAVGHLTKTATTTHGGHIVAVSLGGYASGPNLFPQVANFNVSAFARLERSWRAALAEGSAVGVDIALEIGDGTTPDFVIVTQWENGHEETLALLNEGFAQ